MAVKVFLGVFSAMGACLALFFLAWGVALFIDDGWRTAVGVLLALAAGVCVVTAAIVLGVRHLTAAREVSP
jgi:hypothetical protein